MQSRLVVAGAVVAALIVAACGSGAQSTASASPSATASSSPAGAATIAVASNAKLGQILVDGAGKTLYLFVADSGSSSTCYTACAQRWPLVLTSGPPQAGTDANASLLGVTT